MKAAWTVLVAGVMILVIGGVVTRTVREQSPPLPEYGDAPKFSLVDVFGKKFSDTDLEGDIWIGSFFFTRCPDVCPALNGRLSKVYQAFKNHPDVHLVSISTDPERDTPEVLSKYSEIFQSDPERWHFLTGTKEEIEPLLRKGFRFAAGELPAEHSTQLVLVDRKGKVRGYYRAMEDESLDSLASDINRLLGR